MTNWEKDKIKLNNIDVATFDKVDNTIIDYLKEQIKNKKKLKKVINKLAGHINDEFNISVTKDYSNYICSCIGGHSITNNILKSVDILSRDMPIFVKESWINFQKKYEFNPLHDHSGIFSFIIFMQIPYKIEEEMKVFPNVNGQSTSCLSFVYNQVDGKIQVLNCNVDESYLYKMLIFPAKLNHMVYPFYTSNKERITVSGNVKFFIE